ncbi:hypothetical protein U27_06268 [Candidatus Vecturithrix granuli]|uniref:EVE domain-containing protein n=1 Tax=Vecturithrix granuli TaxID=1499967 RepID=A0A081C3Y6_VECG1|nr:hypothetical protein U27_06268 [Candidatus Vecturithrix granuli]
MSDHESTERQYWLWVTRPEYYLDEEGNDREDLEPANTEASDGWWTCHRETRKGDLVLLYRSRIKKDIAYLIQAESDAYSIRDENEEGWEYGCNYRVLYKFSPPISLQTLKKEPTLSNWVPLRLSFQRSVFQIQPDVWEKLNHLIIQYHPEYKQFLSKIEYDHFYQTKIPLPIYEQAERTTELQLFSNIKQTPFEFRPGCPPKISSTVSSQTERRVDVALRHNDLQQALYRQLAEKYGEKNVGTEIDSGIGTSIDVVVRQGEEYWFYEIKTDPSPRVCIRQAIGQLLEYAFWPGSQEATRLIIVSEVKIDRDGEKYLQTLKDRYALPLDYEQIVTETGNCRWG